MQDADSKVIIFFDADTEWLEFARETLPSKRYRVLTAESNAALEDLVRDLAEHETALFMLDEPSLFESFETTLGLVSSRGRAKSAFAVLFVGRLDTDRARNMFKAGAVDCVWKPHSELELTMLVEQILASERINTYRSTTESTAASGNVLVVDDDDGWASYMVNYLPPVEHIEVANSYDSAKEKVEEQSFDLVISDLRLDDADENNSKGMGLLELIRGMDKKRGSKTSLIAVSAYGTEGQIVHAYKDLGVDYYFAKQTISQFEYRGSVEKALSKAGRVIAHRI